MSKKRPSDETQYKTEYQRRYRRHRNGDHSQCERHKCPVRAVEDALDAQNAAQRPAQGAAEAPETASEQPRLRKSGQELYDAVMAVTQGLSPLQMPLLLEACRIADRLDRLDIQLHGGDWLRFRTRSEDESGVTEVVMVVDRLLAESREQAVALKGIVADLVRSLPAETAVTNDKGGGGGIVDLAALVASRAVAAAS